MKWRGLSAELTTTSVIEPSSGLRNATFSNSSRPTLECNPVRARPDEATGVRQRIIVVGAAHRARPGIDRDDAAAGGAAAGMRAAGFIEREVPEQHATGPMPRGADDEPAHLHGQPAGVDRLPIAARALGEARILVGQRGVHLVLRETSPP